MAGWGPSHRPARPPGQGSPPLLPCGSWQARAACPRRHRGWCAILGAKQVGTPERRTANRPSANLVNQQQPKRTSTQKLQGRGGWARFVKGLGAVQTRGDAGKAYRQPTFGEPCKPTTTKTNLDAEIARPGGLGEVCQRPGRCSTFVLSPSV